MLRRKKGNDSVREDTLTHIAAIDHQGIGFFKQI
jgi:hypothetical protein